MVKPFYPSLTYDDYAVVSGEWDHELLGGSLVREPAPTPKHQRIAGYIYNRMANFLALHPVGEALVAPVDVKPAEHTVVQPDVLFIASARLHIIKEKWVEGAPDLVVEVLSPDSRKRDRETKRKLYEEHGASEYWIVEPIEKTVSVYYRDPGSRRAFQIRRYGIQGASEVAEDATVVESPLLPGLEVPLPELFGIRVLGY